MKRTSISSGWISLIFVAGFAPAAGLAQADPTPAVPADATTPVEKPPEGPPAWANESEVGVAIVSGNAASEAYNGKQTTVHQFDLNKLRFGARLLQASSRGAEIARSWEASLRYDRVTSERMSVFAGFGLESDVFAGYVQRDNADLGGRFEIAKSTPTQWLVEAGYRYSYSNFSTQTGKDPVAHLARLFTEFGQTLSETASTKIWLEYLPNLKTSEDFRINGEVSLVSQISTVFALKAGYLVKHQSVVSAPATVMTDSFFTSALVAKF